MSKEPIAFFVSAIDGTVTSPYVSYKPETVPFEEAKDPIIFNTKRHLKLIEENLYLYNELLKLFGLTRAVLSFCTNDNYKRELLSNCLAYKSVIDKHSDLQGISLGKSFYKGYILHNEIYDGGGIQLKDGEFVDVQPQEWCPNSKNSIGDDKLFRIIDYVADELHPHFDVKLTTYADCNITKAILSRFVTEFQDQRLFSSDKLPIPYKDVYVFTTGRKEPSMENYITEPGVGLENLNVAMKRFIITRKANN